MTASVRALIDIGEVARMLNARVDSLCRELLPRGRREGAEWSAICPWRADGKPGSFKVRLTGAKAGIWQDFATAEGGDCLDLVAAVLFHDDKRLAFSWARRWLNLESGSPDALETARRATPSAEKLEAEREVEAEAARAGARRIWLAAHPRITGTPVEAYLAGRGIPLAELGRVPGAIRFHPRLWHVETERYWPAMVTAIARMDGRGLIACHRTWLEATPAGVRKAPIEKNKRVLGAYRGAHISLWRGHSGKPIREAPVEVLDITEGIEDGLSVALATPEARVIAAISLSNLAALEIPPHLTTLRIWKQNDTAPAALAAFDRAIRAHMAAGRTILIPRIPPGLKDVNDLLRADG